MDKKTIALIVMGILLVIPLMFAQTYQQGVVIDLKIPFEVNGSIASSSATCNVSINYPNGTYLIENTPMTNRENGDFNITLNASKINPLGEYEWRVFCCDSSDCAAGYGNFEVTPTGKEITSGQGFASIGLIIAIILLSGLFAFFGFKLAETGKLFPIALFFMLISLILGVYTIHLGYIYTRDILYPISTEGSQFKIYIGIIWGLLAMGFIALLFFILQTLKEFKVRKALFKYGEGWNPKTKSYE